MKYEKPNIRFEAWEEEEDVFTASLEEGGGHDEDGGDVDPWDGDNPDNPPFQW